MLSLNAQIVGFTLILDIHGMTVQQAKKEMQSVLKSCPKIVREIEVIHGYNGGKALQQYIRSIKHPKVERSIIGLNDGKTTLILKK
ncbi:MAG: Smr/MutS family protein [Ruminococcus sp.]|nr:Smr/MutS family protein [Ruminococcus sp.]